MKPIILFSFLLLLALTSTTCKDSNPVDNNCTDCPTKPDTTSHNFIWKLDTLGAEGSVVNDVAVISKNDIWAVGRFYKTPFGTSDDTTYNAMHWDGVMWELNSIPIKNYSGTITPTQLTAVWGKLSNEIWVVSIGGSYGKYNGTTWQSAWIAERQGGITRIWGESSNKLYFGGTNGSLTYWNGSVFTKLETGTIQAVSDMHSKGDTLLISFSDRIILLDLQTNKTSDYFASGLLPPFYSIWWDSKNSLMYLGSGNGFFTKSFQDTSWSAEKFQPPFGILNITGQGNNLFISGGFFYHAHFNGSSWKVLSGSDPLNSVNGNWKRSVLENNIIVMIGNENYPIFLKGVQQ